MLQKYLRGCLLLLFVLRSCGGTTPTPVPTTPVATSLPPTAPMATPTPVPQGIFIWSPPPETSESFTFDNSVTPQPPPAPPEIVMIIDSSASVEEYKDQPCDPDGLRFEIARYLLTVIKFQSPSAQVRVLHLDKRDGETPSQPLPDDGKALLNKPPEAGEQFQAIEFNDDVWEKASHTKLDQKLTPNDYVRIHRVSDQFTLGPITENKEDRVVILIGDGNFDPQNYTRNLPNEQRMSLLDYQGEALNALNQLGSDRKTKILSVLICSQVIGDSNLNWWKYRANVDHNIDGLYSIDSGGISQNLSCLLNEMGELIDQLVTEHVLPAYENGPDSWHWGWLTKDQPTASIEMPLKWGHAAIYVADVIHNWTGFEFTGDNGEHRQLDQDDTLEIIHRLPEFGFFPLPSCMTHTWQIGPPPGFQFAEGALYFYWWTAKRSEIQFDRLDVNQIALPVHQIDFTLSLSVTDFNDPDWDKLNECYRANMDLSWAEVNPVPKVSDLPLSPRIQWSPTITDTHLLDQPPLTGTIDLGAQIYDWASSPQIYTQITQTLPVYYQPSVHSPIERLDDPLGGAANYVRFALTFKYIDQRYQPALYEKAQPSFQFTGNDCYLLGTYATSYGDDGVKLGIKDTNGITITLKIYKPIADHLFEDCERVRISWPEWEITPISSVSCDLWGKDLKCELGR